MSLVTEQHSMRNPRAVLHWYDFLCPFCYIGQRARNGDACRGHAKSLEKAQNAAKGQNRPVFSMERPTNEMPEDFRDRTCQGA